METEKKYLKTLEEVSDALAAGKVVYFDDNRQDTLKKDENGLILLENKYETKLCVGCFLGIEDKPYILEPKPLQVKQWHLYENEQGIKFLAVEKYLGPEKMIYLMNCLCDGGLYSYYKNGQKSVKEEKNGRVLVKELADLSEYFK